MIAQLRPPNHISRLRSRMNRRSSTMRLSYRHRQNQSIASSRPNVLRLLGRLREQIHALRKDRPQGCSTNLRISMAAHDRAHQLRRTVVVRRDERRKDGLCLLHHCSPFHCQALQLPETLQKKLQYPLKKMKRRARIIHLTIRSVLQLIILVRIYNHSIRT